RPPPHHGGAHLPVPQPLLADAPEELRVLGVRARPAAFEVVNAQLVQPPRDFQFVVDRKRQALALRAVSQCRVVQEHVPHPSRRSVRDIKSGAASRLLERPRRASSGPTARQPSASTPPLRWSRMVMLVMDRLAQRTPMAVILTPGRGPSIPRALPPGVPGPGPPNRSPL